MSLISIIDIGTQSILYMLAEINGKRGIHFTDQQIHSTRLGMNLARLGSIQGDALTRTIDVLKRLALHSKRANVSRIIAVGTQALRSAINADTAVKAILDETGIHVEILSEEQEAYWSYRGAVHSNHRDEDVLVIDIGGGSTELITGHGVCVAGTESFPIGAVTLTERFLHRDPPSEEELDALHAAVEAKMADSRILDLDIPTKPIGVGGTITTLAAMVLRLKVYEPNGVHGRQIDRMRIREILEQLKKMSIVRRRSLVRMDPERADIILAGIVILDFIMEKGRISTLRVSDHGLRHGLALREKERMTARLTT